ncbi:MAG TPA: MBL fold metallo-hydrolase [Thermoleophilaceae bacterium]|nr:MBL fold metallo-hydrolase [Thermoleophilaceae bacterium]
MLERDAGPGIHRVEDANVNWYLVEDGARFHESDTLDVPGSPAVVFSPGHTLGHCALHFPERDTLIAGDSIVMLDPYTAETGPRIVAGAATADYERALGSLDALAATGARTVLTGHGDAWGDGIENAVAQARRVGPT